MLAGVFRSVCAGPRSLLLLALCTLLVGPGAPAAQQQQQQEAPGPAAPITALVEQLTGLFPSLQGEVQGGTVTLDVGRKNGARPGLTLEIFRQGREITHPRTGQVLGRAEQTLGT